VKLIGPEGIRLAGAMALKYEASEDAATAVPAYLRRLKELATKYSE